MSSWMIALILFAAAGPDLTTGPVEVVSEGHTFAEGPLWIPEQGWIFTDVATNTVHRVDGEPLLRDSEAANGLALDRDGRVLLCQQAKHAVSRLETDGSVTVLVDRYQGTRLNAPNDLVVRSDGTVFFTDPEPLRDDAQKELGFSGVYALQPNGELVLITKELDYPNGIALSPDEKTLYVSDTRGAEIRAFQIDGTRVRSSKRFCEVRIPDGMAVDSLGFVWSTSVSGVAVFNPSGEQVHAFVTKMPTNCAFGGPDYKTLLITTRTEVVQVQCANAGIRPAFLEK